MAETNYYETLQVESSATEESIKTAIRNARRRYRQLAGSPDKAKARKAEEMMELLAKAETTLLDPAKRAAYTKTLRSKPTAQPSSSASQPKAPPAPPAPPKPAQPDPVACERWLQSAEEYLAQSQFGNAVQAAVEATTADPYFPDAWVIRARACLQNQDLRGADFAASEANRLRADDPFTIGLLGDIHARAGRHVEAERAYARASQLDHQTVVWKDRLMWAMATNGNHDGSIQLGKSLVTAYPSNVMLRDTLATQLLNKADASLSARPNDLNRYMTNPNQMAFFADCIAQVQSLGTLGTTATARLATAIQHLEASNRTKYFPLSGKQWSFVVLYVVLLTWLAQALLQAIMGDVAGMIVWLLGNAAAVYFFIRRTWRKQWKINQALLGPSAKTGLQ